MKRALIIGGSGYIGRYTSKYLEDKGIGVRVYDRIGPGNGFEFIYGDIRDIRKVVRAAEDCDAIVILAGIVGDRACNESPALADEVNHKAVNWICNTLTDRQIILMSTCAVYGAQNELLHENSALSPLSLYATTKVNAEHHITSVEGTVFRLGSVYGIGMPNYIRMDSIINFLTLSAIRDRKFKILGPDQWKSLIHVRDVAGFIEEAIRSNIRGTYNISAQNVQLKSIAEELVKQIDCVSEILPALPDDRNYKINNAKRMNTFTYQPKHSMAYGIFELIEFFKTR